MVREVEGGEAVKIKGKEIEREKAIYNRIREMR